MVSVEPVRGSSEVKGTEVNLRLEPQYQPFLSDDFDPSQFASNALSDTKTTVQAQIDHLNRGIAMLESQLRSVVLQNRQELLARGSRLDVADASLQRITLTLRSLQSVAARVQAEITEPYKIMSIKTLQLRNVQRTVDLLRHTIYRSKLIDRLKQSMMEQQDDNQLPNDSLSLARTAKMLSDIRAATAEADLSGIEVIDREKDFIKNASLALYARIDTTLRSGLESTSQTDVGTALQALYNLQELPSSVSAHINGAISLIERTFSAALDPKKLNLASSSSLSLRSLPGSGKAQQEAFEALFKKIQDACDAVERISLSIWHLQRVLIKKRDPLTHEVFIDVVTRDGTPLPLDRFWEGAVAAVATAFKSCHNDTTQRGGIVRSAIVSSYPRIAAMLESMCSKILKGGTSGDVRISPLQIEKLLAAPKDAEDSFLSGMKSRLQTAIANALPTGSRSTSIGALEIQTLVAKIHEELNSVSSGVSSWGSLERLVTLVSARVIGWSITEICSRLEMMAASGPEVRAVGSGCNAAQARNINLCNAAYEIHRSLAPTAAKLPFSAVECLVGPLEELQKAQLDIIAPLFRAMVDMIQECILKIHLLNLGAENGAEGSIMETSPYINDLVRLLSMCRVEYLSKFVPAPATASTVTAPAMGRISSVATALSQRMASRILTFFVRHASLVKPLTQAGKLQIAKDAGELEATVTQNLVSADQVTPALRTFKAFLRLIFLETTEIEADNHAVRRDMPAAILLHHLFSRTPSYIESPHTRLKLTPSQYSLWLDEHSEEEVMKFITGAVEAAEEGFQKKAKSMDSKPDSSVIQVMRKVLEDSRAKRNYSL